MLDGPKIGSVTGNDFELVIRLKTLVHLYARNRAEKWLTNTTTYYKRRGSCTQCEEYCRARKGAT